MEEFNDGSYFALWSGLHVPHKRKQKKNLV